ncbi:MAG: hypothetical protein ACOC7K_01605 [bacterium]
MSFSGTASQGRFCFEMKRCIFYLMTCGLFLLALGVDFTAKGNYAQVPRFVAKAHTAEEPEKSSLVQQGRDTLAKAQRIQYSSYGISVLAIASWVVSRKRKERGWQPAPAIMLGLHVFMQFMCV